jgi:tripartite-type tricarboxylate transporter receptor subunit TctC
MTILRLLLTCACVVLFATSAAAQAWPAKPVRVLIGFPPGGPSDTSTRLVTEELAKSLGQPFVIESKPGAGGNIAAETVAKSPPDGYTLFAGNSGALAVNPSLYAALPFEPAKDFTPITLMVVTPMVLMVPADSPAKSAGDLVQMMRTKGREMNYGSPGIGTLPHVAGEMIKGKVKGESAHVAYRGTAGLMDAAVKGEVQWLLDSPIAGIGLAKAGKIRILAIAAPERWPTLPDVPTTAQAGLADVEALAWFGLVGPAGLPAEVVRKVNEGATAALRKPEIAEKLLALGLAPKPLTPAATAKFMADSREQWRAVVRAYNVKVE